MGLDFSLSLCHEPTQLILLSLPTWHRNFLSLSCVILKADEATFLECESSARTSCLESSGGSLFPCCFGSLLSLVWHTIVHRLCGKKGWWWCIGVFPPCRVFRASFALILNWQTVCHAPNLVIGFHALFVGDWLRPACITRTQIGVPNSFDSLVFLNYCLKGMVCSRGMWAMVCSYGMWVMVCSCGMWAMVFHVDISLSHTKALENRKQPYTEPRPSRSEVSVLNGSNFSAFQINAFPSFTWKC